MKRLSAPSIPTKIAFPVEWETTQNAFLLASVLLFRSSRKDKISASFSGKNVIPRFVERI